MIYTVSFNPAWDYVVRVDDFKVGRVNRMSGESIMFGGKGINVSAVLRELGVESVALGYEAGFTGAALKKELVENGIREDFIHLDRGMTRINVKLKTDDETDINGQGPDIDEAAVKKLFEKLDGLSAGDWLVLAGSIPSTMPDNIYEQILKWLDGRGIMFVVDATRELLVNVLKYKPFLIKPNNHELGEIFGVALTTDEEIAEKARELQSMGAQNVLVSMAGDGALLVDVTGEVHRLEAFKGKAVNSVGAGDSMVAGFIAGYIKRGDFGYALRLGSAAGSATAFSESLAKRGEIEALLNESI